MPSVIDRQTDRQTCIARHTHMQTDRQQTDPHTVIQHSVASPN